MPLNKTCLSLNLFNKTHKKLHSIYWYSTVIVTYIGQELGRLCPEINLCFDMKYVGHYPC